MAVANDHRAFGLDVVDRRSVLAAFHRKKV
jgi:hypothetical protein